MKIFAVFDDPEKSVSLNELNQIATLTKDELSQCLDGLHQAQQAVKTGQTVKAIVSHFSSPSPRFRRERVEENVRAVAGEWESFGNWSGGQLSRLCLLTKPEVVSIVTNRILRETVRNQLPDITIPAGFVDKLKDCKCNTSQLILKIQGFGDSAEGPETSSPVQLAYPLNDYPTPLEQQNPGNEGSHTCRKRSGSVHDDLSPSSKRCYKPTSPKAGINSAFNKPLPGAGNRGCAVQGETGSFSDAIRKRDDSKDLRSRIQPGSVHTSRHGQVEPVPRTAESQAQSGRDSSTADNINTFIQSGLVEQPPPASSTFDSLYSLSAPVTHGFESIFGSDTPMFTELWECSAYNPDALNSSLHTPAENREATE